MAAKSPALEQSPNGHGVRFFFWGFADVISCRVVSSSVVVVAGVVVVVVIEILQDLPSHPVSQRQLPLPVLKIGGSQ